MRKVKYIRGVCLALICLGLYSNSTYADTLSQTAAGQQQQQNQSNNQMQTSSNLNTQSYHHRKQPFYVSPGTGYYGKEGYYKQFSNPNARQNDNNTNATSNGMNNK
jgi:hypothetical protein